MTVCARPPNGYPSFEGSTHRAALARPTELKGRRRAGGHGPGARQHRIREPQCVSEAARSGNGQTGQPIAPQGRGKKGRHRTGLADNCLRVLGSTSCFSPPSWTVYANGGGEPLLTPLVGLCGATLSLSLARRNGAKGMSGRGWGGTSRAGRRRSHWAMERRDGVIPARTSSGQPHRRAALSACPRPRR